MSIDAKYGIKKKIRHMYILSSIYFLVKGETMYYFV